MSEAGPARLSGQCLRGVVGYEVDDAFEYALYCHCSRCWRATGSAFKPLAGIRREALTFVRGADRVLRYGDVVTHDAHCGACGSLLYSQVRDARWVHVALGSLVDPPAIRPTHHIFVGSKAPWFAITDGLPQFEAFD